jgi:hypothetical protein
MAAKQLDTFAQFEAQALQDLKAVIAKKVIQQLGEPINLRRVEVRRLWENRYRVNVFVGAESVSATLPNSYFLVVDGEGDIVTSTPAITRQY